MNRGIPLLTCSLVFFSLTRGCAAEAWFQSELQVVNMRSGDAWSVTPRDAFFVGSVFLVLIDLGRSGLKHGKSLFKHALSAVVLVASAIMLIECRGFGNSIFVIFTSLAFFDLIAGIIITMAVSHRDRAYRPPDDDD
jgi:hypothetical protein